MRLFGLLVMLHHELRGRNNFYRIQKFPLQAGSSKTGDLTLRKLEQPLYYPFTPATNATGFTALPGGQRYFSGRFKYLGAYGSWWSSTELNGSSRSWLLSFSDNFAYNNEFSKNGGCSVRCLRD